MDQHKMIYNHHSDNNNNNNNNNDNKGVQWTNEKHTSFLRGIEADFVRNMMLNKSCYINNNNNNNHQSSSRLDRFVPDISESTLDLNKPDRVSRTCYRLRVIPIRPYQLSHDQVVPQLENKAANNK